MDNDDTMINTRQKKVKKLLLNFPTILLGFVSKLVELNPLFASIMSDPKAISTEKNVNINKFKIIDKLPFVISL